MKKNLYDLPEIIQFLKEIPSTFKIVLFKQKTNYNTLFRCLYLNYEDLSKLELYFQEIEKPPFSFKVDNQLTQKYYFDVPQKILYLKEKPQSQNSTMFSLKERCKKQVLSDFEFEDLNASCKK